MVRALSWHALRVAPRELRLDLTLSNGQCFGWQRSPSDESTWIGVVGPRVIALRQTEQDCLFRCLGTARTAAPVRADDAKVRVRAELSDVFQLDRLIEPLREEWSASDPRMQSVCTALPGMRILRQDPVECLFSFICSSNNNIGRITGMLQAIRRAYGEHIPLSDPNALDDHSLPDIPLSDPTAAADPSLPRIPLTNPSAGDAISMPGDDDDLSLPHTDYFAFPTIAALAAASETDLRALGLGYRAPYLLKTAEALMQRGDAWLGSLRASRDPAYVRSELCGLMGVGPKVADCVALFSLDQTDAVPVDTHVWTIACREYDASLRLCASLTPEVYRRVGQLFRSRYGSHAGWAHSVLFAAELPQFSRFLPMDMQEGLKRNAAAEREQKKRDREEAGKRRIVKAEAKAAKEAQGTVEVGADLGPSKRRIGKAEIKAAKQAEAHMVGEPGTAQEAGKRRIAKAVVMASKQAEQVVGEVGEVGLAVEAAEVGTAVGVGRRGIATAKTKAVTEAHGPETRVAAEAGVVLGAVKRTIGMAKTKVVKQAEARGVARAWASLGAAGGEREEEEPAARGRAQGTKRQLEMGTQVGTPGARAKAPVRRRVARPGSGKNGGEDEVSSAAWSEDDPGMPTVASGRRAQ